MPRAAKQLDQYPPNPTANSGSPRCRACSHALAVREAMIVGPQLSSAERQAKARWSLSQAYAHGTWKPDFKLLAQVGNIGEPSSQSGQQPMGTILTYPDDVGCGVLCGMVRRAFEVGAAKGIAMDRRTCLPVDHARVGPKEELILSLVDDFVWASWSDAVPKVRLGKYEFVTATMRDFLAQCELGERLQTGN